MWTGKADLSANQMKTRPVTRFFYVSAFASGLYPPASEVSREVANLTERKNQHTPMYGVKEFVRL